MLLNKAEVIDITGLHVYPGFIASATSLGLVEINAVRASEDHSEVGKFNPNVRVERAYNPDSELVPITRSNGILNIHLIPKSGRISGTSGLVCGGNLGQWQFLCAAAGVEHGSDSLGVAGFVSGHLPGW